MVKDVGFYELQFSQSILKSESLAIREKRLAFKKVFNLLKLKKPLILLICQKIHLALSRVIPFKQGKKTDGSVNAFAVNTSMKRKYRYVINNKINNPVCIELFFVSNRQFLRIVAQAPVLIYSDDF